ncbi:MAG: alcohol dehydrogenase [Candidatus Jettenia sp.]|uniref:Alcohol dehydrogenase n=1 Tax=Candidatus Jettenia caeni TaxID=247490 RepID=I3IR33_9BACT|nr:zinc-binding dehydrogenase [Candidatus Jettenia sp. AMX1]MBC6928536.1 alcohol dehydrogenase [Candidatus Jettenia sp.]NUN23976.1 zinc-binding dehydrogenase [Candidatus Jettenia caeni]KAA0249160.1 MAG: alcohol dehydrogenase [Candidatus Jettenia sp. AMX1]MCE7879756.1 alcohol dehydrogenase [Candidatus Jettenia sp. AMX1]MCQ3926437.1 alcohol dehydrogenase [Candidatus Jettenia sp.]
MKAVVFYEHGGVDRLTYTDREKPKISPYEVLVKVKACALNHLDIWVRQGLPGAEIPMPHIPGSDIAGEVAEAGMEVKKFRPGDKVLIAPGVRCRKCVYCITNNDSMCSSFKIMGFQVQGGYAEFAKAHVDNIIPVSDKHSFEEWAAIPLVFLTAWHMLITRGQLKPGENVLIHAAGSGIGSAAIQIARVAGARVITTARGKEKLEKAKQIGADEVIDYSKDDYGERVRSVTNNKGVDLIFEHIGPDTWEKNLQCLTKGGRMVVCGATSGPTTTIDIRFLYMKQHTILGCYMGSKKELFDVLNLVELGRLRPVIDTVFPLKDAAAAQQRMLNRENFGKIVLKV